MGRPLVGTCLSLRGGCARHAQCHAHPKPCHVRHISSDGFRPCGTATGTRQSPLGLGTWCALGNAVGRGAAPRAAETRPEEDYGRVVEQPQQRHETDGIALALTFLIGGGLCLLAPKYFAATGWEETAWHVAGLVLATVGALGLISELSPTNAGETVLSDVAVGLVLLRWPSWSR